MSNKKLATTLLFFSALFIFTACNDSNTTNNNTATTENSAVAENEEQANAAQENLAPEAIFKDINGQDVSISSLRGKVVFINFWATWCPPCKAELPSIQQLKNTYPKDAPIEFLFVDVNEPIQQAKDYMDNNNFDLPVYVPVDAIPSAYLGQAIPTTIIIDKEGSLVARLEGARDFTSPEIKNIIDGLVGSSI